MSKDKDLESILGQPLFFDESEEEENELSDDEELLPQKENEEIVSIVEPSLDTNKLNATAPTNTSVSKFTDKDFSIFTKNPASPLEVHFASANEVKKSLQEMSVNQNAQEVIKPVMYELKKNIEEITRLTEDVIMDLHIPSIDTKAHKTYYNFFETKKTDNKINFIVITYIYQYMTAYNHTVQDYWKTLQGHFEKLALFPKTKETFQKILRNEITARLKLTELTDEFLGYLKKYLHITKEEFVESKRKFKTNAEYYDSINYSWASFCANSKDKRTNSKSHSDSTVKPSTIEPKSPKSLSSTNTQVQENIGKPLQGDSEKLAEKQKVKKKNKLKTEITREKIQATEIINPIDMVKSKNSGRKVALKYIPISSLVAEHGRIEAIQHGSKEWNTGNSYSLTVLLEELQKEEEIIEIAFHLSCDENDKYEKVKYSTAIVRAGTAKSKLENYQNMIANIFHKLEQIDIPSEMSSISSDLLPTLIYHLGPQYLYEIFLSTLKQGRYGFISYINKSKSIETTYLNYFIKYELILWWNTYFGNFSTAQADQYLNYSKIIESLKEQYIIDLTNARTKQKEFIKLHAAKIENFDAEDHFKKHWKQFFSIIKVPVYKRFLTKSVFR